MLPLMTSLTANYQYISESDDPCLCLSETTLNFSLLSTAVYFSCLSLAACRLFLNICRLFTDAVI